jgi:LAO/AO transport system kinase
MMNSAPDDAWVPPILRTVASKAQGIAEMITGIEEHRNYLERSRELTERRARRTLEELREILEQRLERRARDLVGAEKYRALLGDLRAGTIDPYAAADEILRPVSG